MLPRSRRVTTRLVKEIMSQTRPLYGRFLYIRAMPEKGLKESLFSVIVPKSLEKSSVGRHKLRRKINEALKKAMLAWPKGMVVVVFAKAEAKKALRDEIVEDGTALLSKIRI